MSERDHQAEALFEAARRLTDPAHRDAFLDFACTGDAALRKRLDDLLGAQDAADDFFRPLPVPPRAVASAPVASEPVPDEHIGTMVGRYKLLQKIGEGGFGVVYLAKQKEPVKRRVALKIIKLGMDTKQVVARFEAERQALALMDHPNIARIYDGGMTGAAPFQISDLKSQTPPSAEKSEIANPKSEIPQGRPYFAMELVRGVPITQYCDDNQLSTNERLQLFLQVCHAVQHAHQKGVIHRDLKPSNILVTINDGQAVPKVIDFGVAKATQQELTDKTIVTLFHHFIGTPAYMSPEQVAMTSLDIDTRSDIYALGVLLYELLTGKTPFDGKELLASGLDEMRRTIREKDPPRPSTRLSEMAEGDRTTVARLRKSEAPKLIHQLRGDLDWIVMKCLEKDRNRRYETANSVAMDLKRHLDNEPVVARPPSAAYQFQKLVRRNKLTFLAAGAVLLALIIGLAVSTWSLFKEKQARQRAVTAEQEAQTARANESTLRRQAEADRKIAQTEAAKSKQVARFLEELLRGVAPSATQGRELMELNGILSSTLYRAGQDLKNQPEVLAELLSIISRVYRELHQYRQAENAAREGLRLSRSSFGETNKWVAIASCDVARTLLAISREAGGSLVESQALARQALAIWQHLGISESEEVAEATAVLAGTLYGQGKLAEAESPCRQALAMRRRLLRENADPLGTLTMQRRSYWEIADSLGTLGSLLRDQGKLLAAEEALREAVAIEKEGVDGEAPIYLVHLGDVLQLQNKTQESEYVFQEYLMVSRRLFGTNDQYGMSLLIRFLSQNRDQPQTAKLLEEAARAGYANAQNALGELCAAGQGVAQNEAEAAEWYRKAAEQGFAAAQLNLARMYSEGRGVPKDETEAIKWGTRAANFYVNAGDLRHLGFQANGDGFAKGQAEAVTWYRRTAEQGDAQTQNDLGSLYATGKVVAKDEKQAVVWFRKAAEQNHLQAQINLASSYAAGRGAAKDLAEAARWYRKAADQNNTLAQVSLARMYATGRGVARDPIESAKWLRKAVEQQDSADLNEAAWVLATSLDPDLRDGATAVKLAEVAVAATRRAYPSYLDTLAAAYAEFGEFEKAVSTQQEAIALNRDEQLRMEFVRRLKLYEANSPFHQTPAAGENSNPPSAPDQKQNKAP